MEIELQKRLRERYPALLRYPERTPISERSIEVMDGWHDLIERTLARLEAAGVG